MKKHLLFFFLLLLVSTITYSQIVPSKPKRITLSNELKIAYSDVGKNDTVLLFIHGLGGYQQVWQKNIAALKTKYRCIALDLPGCGFSSTGNYSFSIAFLGDVVQEFIDSMRLSNVVLIGHSLGGQIALQVASEPSAAIIQLVLLAPSGLKTFSSWEKTGILWLAEPERVKKRTEQQLCAAFNAGFASGKAPQDAQFMLDYRLKLKERPTYFEYFADMMYKTNQGILGAPMLGKLPKINIPTLILWGKEDAQLPSKQAEVAAQRIPLNTVQYLSPCGHMLQWECADTVNAAILNFIRVPTANGLPPVALMSVDRKACIPPCTVQFTNHSLHADQYVWLVNGVVVARSKDFELNVKKTEGYEVKLIAWKGSLMDEMIIMIRGLGE